MRINSHGSQAVVIGAQLTSAYAAISNVTFQAQTQTDLTVLLQMMNSTVDLGFMVYIEHTHYETHASHRTAARKPH